MSETATLITNGTKLLKEGRNARGPYKLFGLLDEYDEVFGTWFNDMSLKREIDDVAGSELQVEFKTEGDYKTILSVSAGSNGSEPVQTGPSSSPAAGFGSLPETAWLSASQMAKSDLGFDAAKHLADRILADLKLKHGIDPDDFPF